LTTVGANGSSPQTWFVTGAAGFIGSNLALMLLARGDRVIGFDNLLTGHPENIVRLETEGGSAFRFVKGDILDRPALAAAMAGADRVVHLAAQVSVQRSLDDPMETNAINVEGFLNTFLVSAEKGIGRFIYASSCAVYGDNPHLPLGEDVAPRPLSPYAASKLINEHYAGSLASRSPDMAVIGLRFFNIYGPWQDHRSGYAAVIPKWIDLCLSGRQPIVYGDGTATRDFCYVGDVAAAVIRAGTADLRSRQPVVCNIATGQSLSLRALFDVIRDRLHACGVDLPWFDPIHEPWRSGDIVHSCGDPARATDDLGFRAETPIADGIAQVLKRQYGLPCSK